VTDETVESIDIARIREVVALARGRGSAGLLEPEAREILAALGVPVPAAAFVPVREGVVDAADVEAAVAALPGERVVVRVVAPSVVHKTELGGVAVVGRDARAVTDAVADMRARLDAAGIGDLAGFMVAEFVAHDPGIGGELLVSARWTGDAGPVVSVGAGGTEAEAIAADLRPGREVAILSPTLTRPGEVADTLRAVTAVRLATTSQRGRPPRLQMERLVEVVQRFLALAEACVPGDLSELEVNPIVVAGGRLVALDALAVAGPGAGSVAPPGNRPTGNRPTGKLARLLEPRSVAVIGVSASMNAGHVILSNLLHAGFDARRITVVKPGADEIEGCRCVPDVASLPGKVDVFVVAVSAAQAAFVVAEVIERDAAETLLVIPGGLEEKEGTEAIVGRMRAALDASRARPDGGPLLIGGNCLGYRSVPGRCDTMFIPGAKLPPPAGDPLPLAIVAQSGAFAITRLGRLAGRHPRYLLTVGNQTDVTVGDCVDFLADDPEITVLGVYVEGFQPLDAVRFVAAARRVRERGGTVVLYRGGRSAAGAAASASHTASIAGDVVATRALARGAGVLVADTVDEFDDLLRTATLLAGRTVAGSRLGAISNAGFECVTIADSLGSLELAAFDAATESRLGEILAASGAGGIVDVRNPLDATPMPRDAAFAELAEAVVTAPGVDVAVVGVVPFAPSVQTLPAGPDHAEDLAADDAVAAYLVDLWRRTERAWVAIVDSGPLYDPFAAALEAAGIPVFRTADRALRALGTIVRHRLG
jgi:acyl-CoA synthetase (NDP forming)